MIGNIDLRLYILIVITLSLAAYVNSLKRLFNGEIKKSFLNVGLGIFYNALVLMIMITDNLNESSLLLLSVVPNMILITNLIFGFLPTIITLTIMPLIFINNITQFIYFIPSILVFLFSTLLNNIRSKGYLNNRTACLVFIYSFNIMMFVYFAATYYSWVIDINAYLSLLLVLPLTSFGTILMVDFINNKNLTANNMKIEYDMLMLSLNSTLDLQVKILDKDYRYIETNDAHINKMKEIYGTDVKIGDSYLDKILNEIDRENIKDSIDKAFKGSIFEWIYQNKAGQVLKTYYSPLVTNKNEQAVVLFTQDITDEKIREQEIYKLTFVDALTNTYNRHYFFKIFVSIIKKKHLVLFFLNVIFLKLLIIAFVLNVVIN